MESSDPRLMIDRAAMRPMQIVAVTLCVVLNALDGFDVLAISFASPGIAAEWHVEHAALGWLLAMELFGMAAGSVLLGHVADRIGRRPTTLLCLTMMTAGMAGAALASGVEMLAVVRLCTGLGIGGMLACINAMAAEYSNARNRALAVTVMAAGYPAGAIIGGSVAALLLAHGGWRDIFTFGAIATAALLPLVWWLLPESIGFLMRKRPANALARINVALRRLGHETVAALAPVEERHRVTFGELFRADLIARTGWLTIAYFAHITTFYFILKWVPKIVVDLGHAPSAGERRAGVGECRRSQRGAAVQPVHAPLVAMAAARDRTRGLRDHGRRLRPRDRQPGSAEPGRGKRGFLRECGRGLPLCPDGGDLPRAASGGRYRLRDRDRPWRRGDRAGHSRRSVRRRLRPRAGGAVHGAGIGRCGDRTASTARGRPSAGIGLKSRAAFGQSAQ